MRQLLKLGLASSARPRCNARHGSRRGAPRQGAYHNDPPPAEKSSEPFLASSLPLEEGDRIVSIEIWDSVASNPERRILHDYHVWREALKSVQEIGAFRTVTPNLIAPGAQPGSVRVASMSASGFRVARVRPLMGRYLVDDDEREGALSVVVIGENVWRNRFAGDPAILGRTIQLGPLRIP